MIGRQTYFRANVMRGDWVHKRGPAKTEESIHDQYRHCLGGAYAGWRL